MLSMADEVVLDVHEMGDDMEEVHLQVGRFASLTGASVPHAFIVAVTRTFPDEPTTVDEITVFRPGDVFNVALYMSKCLRAKLERLLFATCFGVFAYATYHFFNPGAELGFPILMTISRTGHNYVLTLGDQVWAPFKTLQELQAMLPPFRAEGERGYEDARADLIEQFAAASR